MSYQFQNSMLRIPLQEQIGTKSMSILPKIGVSFFPVLITVVKGVEGEEWEGGVPLSNQLGGLGSIVSSPAGSGAEPQAETILGRFVCNFMLFHASFSAFNNSCLASWDYIRLLAIVGLMFTFNFSRCRTPQLEFFGVSRPPRHPQ